MFVAELKAGIADLVVHPDANEIRDALAARSMLDARIAAALRDFDAAELWELDNRRSLPDWLRVECALSVTEARRMAHQARRVGDLPTIAAGWEDGSLSTAQVQAATGRGDWYPALRYDSP